MSREIESAETANPSGRQQWYPMTAGRLLVRLERAGLIRIRRPPARGSLLQLASHEKGGGIDASVAKIFAFWSSGAGL